MLYLNYYFLFFTKSAPLKQGYAPITTQLKTIHFTQGYDTGLGGELNPNILFILSKRAIFPTNTQTLSNKPLTKILLLLLSSTIIYFYVRLFCSTVYLYDDVSYVGDPDSHHLYYILQSKHITFKTKQITHVPSMFHSKLRHHHVYWTLV